MLNKLMIDNIYELSNSPTIQKLIIDGLFNGLDSSYILEECYYPKITKRQCDIIFGAGEDFDDKKAVINNNEAIKLLFNNVRLKILNMVL